MVDSSSFSSEKMVRSFDLISSTCRKEEANDGEDSSSYLGHGCNAPVTDQSADVPLAVPLDLGDLLLVLLVFHPQVPSFHFVGLDHVVERFVSLLLGSL